MRRQLTTQLQLYKENSKTSYGASHKTDISLRRKLLHIRVEIWCLSHRKISIRQTIVGRTPQEDGHFYMSKLAIFIVNHLLRLTLLILKVTFTLSDLIFYCHRVNFIK